MATIGIYDSGIGGLTTLNQLSRIFSGNDFYYLADNLNMPFGTKSADEVAEIVYKGFKKLKAHSDIYVLACNTASTVVDDPEAFKLLPPVDCVKEECLLLATPLTLSRLYVPENCRTAETGELASLIEIRASLAFKRRMPFDASSLHCYLSERANAYKSIKRVILGCSHYRYVSEELHKLIPAAKFSDGNAALIAELSECVSPSDKNYKTEFAFTGTDESEKYAFVYSKIPNYAEDYFD